MLIPTARFLALFAILNLFVFWNGMAKAIEHDSKSSGFKGFQYLLFGNEEKSVQPLNPVRPEMTDFESINNSDVIRHVQLSDKTISGCIETQPYSTMPLTENIGIAARTLGNTSDKSIEAFEFQPHFSGLKGPKITLMRKDFENMILYQKGSASEIYHNADISETNLKPCREFIDFSSDVELKHHIDLTDSDKSPLIRSDIVMNNRVRLGGYFMGTLATKFLLYDNLHKDGDLRELNRPDPIRQDVLGFAWQGVNLERLMLSGFATPMPNLYVAAHAGHLEEMFFGYGGEVLYRPYDSALSIGAEAWMTTKRVPYLGAATLVDKDNQQFSALLNLWYDVPQRPFALGLSAGRFLDGDYGVQTRARYTPAQSWSAEGFLTFSNQNDSTLNNDNKTNIFAGLRLSMPLGDLPLVDDNSRQIIELMPFARDKGQRIENPYPLYDLTDPWQAKNLYRYWDRVVAKEE